MLLSKIVVADFLSPTTEWANFGTHKPEKETTVESPNHSQSKMSELNKHTNNLKHMTEYQNNHSHPRKDRSSHRRYRRTSNRKFIKNKSSKTITPENVKHSDINGSHRQNGRYFENIGRLLGLSVRIYCDKHYYGIK